MSSTRFVRRSSCPRRTALSALLVSLVLWPAEARAQTFVQEGPKLVGTGAVGTAYQGQSVALSADGTTVLIGGPWDNGRIGAAWGWTRSGGVWTQQGPKLVGTGAVGAAYQGQSVALSADGNTALIGGYGDNSSVGAAWVWTRSGGVWTQQGSKLVGPGAVGTANQAISVSLSADGTTALIGGPTDNSLAGAAWVFAVPPDPPSGLVVSSVVGNVVTLRWTPPPTGPAPTGYTLEGGISPGQVLANIPTGSASPIYTFTAPTGSFFVRMYATIGTRRSTASNEIPLYVNVPVTPSAPANLLG